MLKHEEAREGGSQHQPKDNIELEVKMLDEYGGSS